MDQKKTDELYKILNQISTESNLTDYLSSLDENSPGEVFLPWFENFPTVQSMEKPELMRLSGIKKSTFYQIMSGRRNPDRNHILALCLAAGLDLASTQRALELTKKGILYAKNRRVAILIFCFNNGITNHMEA